MVIVCRLGMDGMVVLLRDGRTCSVLVLLGCLLRVVVLLHRIDLQMLFLRMVYPHPIGFHTFGLLLLRSMFLVHDAIISLSIDIYQSMHKSTMVDVSILVI